MKAIRAAMKAMRHIYRQEFLQPRLVALFLFQVGSGGVYLATPDVRPMGRFRTFQIASGILGSVFARTDELCVRVCAALSRRRQRLGPRHGAVRVG
jgi:hypothetical protein